MTPFLYWSVVYIHVCACHACAEHRISSRGMTRTKHDSTGTIMRVITVFLADALAWYPCGSQQSSCRKLPSNGPRRNHAVGASGSSSPSSPPDNVLHNAKRWWVARYHQYFFLLRTTPTPTVHALCIISFFFAKASPGITVSAGPVSVLLHSSLRREKSPQAHPPTSSAFLRRPCGSESQSRQ